MGSFNILEKVRNLAYRFKLPEDWKVHLVILIVMLELAINIVDLYNRQKTIHSELVEGLAEDIYEVKRIVDKKVT